MPRQTRAENVQKEGRKLLALHALQTGQISSARAAARLYNVPKTSLTDRMGGRPARTDLRANGHKLTQTEEQVLLEWILSMDERGYPLKVHAVGDAAKLLLQQRVGLPSASIRKNWARNFINRQPQIKSKYTRTYDHQRAQCEDPLQIQAWFRLVTNMIQKYGIACEDIYNFDETGFAIGIAGISRVVTASD